jgi:ferritin-like metal-binding protein YciE
LHIKILEQACFIENSDANKANEAQALPKMIEEDVEDEVRDAGLIAAAQRVEHYEMAGYGCARTYGELLGGQARCGSYFRLP